MSTTKYIQLRKVIQFHEVTREELKEWTEYEFFRIHKESDEEWVPEEELAQVERVIRLHKDLGVNNPGIDIILRLTHKLEELQKRQPE
ncbi:chaperone modulator CbpM [Membranicola marinus]|uniref:Chaperone modulator CbpM n=1 Tax=Membranihabitans marinus TaxID=1227546 RepID=A0A953HSQ8_9BACT|nr:chaperone modulator CbpM [Membranihabitans marinus]MBY5957655.1 chaperone modulator CbpM [Membranihabitans marinus]